MGLGSLHCNVWEAYHEFPHLDIFLTLTAMNKRAMKLRPFEFTISSVW